MSPPIRDSCFDCHADRNSGFHDYFEVSRCNPCAKKFDDISNWGKVVNDAIATCENCGAHTGSSSLETCPQCCDHSDIDYPCCLICGKDMAEDLATAAYDHAKDIRKYGH